MRKYDPRLILGTLLILGGLLSLLDNLNIIGNASGIFWGVVWMLVGLYFLYLLNQDRQANWWAAFPGFTLLGIAVTSFLPDSIDEFGGFVFFAGISAAFWWVYFTDKARWWAIIPAGVLLTLGLVSTADEFGFDGGGLFFIGIGLTFALVAILPGGRERTWALVPAVILILFGAFVVSSIGIANYAGPAALILIGGYLVFRFFKP